MKTQDQPAMEKAYQPDRKFLSFLIYIQLKHWIFFKPGREYRTEGMDGHAYASEEEKLPNTPLQVIVDDLKWEGRDSLVNLTEADGIIYVSNPSKIPTVYIFIPYALWPLIDPQINFKFLDSKLLDKTLLERDDKFSSQAETAINTALLEPKNSSFLNPDTCSIVVDYYRIFPRLPAKTASPITNSNQKSNSSDTCLIL